LEFRARVGFRRIAERLQSRVCNASADANKAAPNDFLRAQLTRVIFTAVVYTDRSGSGAGTFDITLT